MTVRTGKTRLAVWINSDGIGYAMPIPFFFLPHLVSSQRVVSARCGVLVDGHRIRQGGGNLTGTEQPSQIRSKRLIFCYHKGVNLTNVKFTPP